jgi:hypothetical protein
MHMGTNDFWVLAGQWAINRYRCDYGTTCLQPVSHIYVREGFRQFCYCHAHYEIAALAMEGNGAPGGAKAPS